MSIISDVQGYLKELVMDEPFIEKIVFGNIYTGVLLDNGNMGMVMNYGDKKPRNDKWILSLIDTPAFKVSDLSHSDSLTEVSVGIAVLNALSVPFIDKDFLSNYGLYIPKVQESNWLDCIQKGDVVTFIGFGGNVGDVIEKHGTSEVHVTELNPIRYITSLYSESGRTEGPLGIELHNARENKDVLSRSDVVLITGSAMTTRTMDELLEYSKPARDVIVYGPSCGLFPVPFFDRGVSHAEITKILDGTRAIDALFNYGFMAEYIMRRYNIISFNPITKKSTSTTVKDKTSGVN